MTKPICTLKEMERWRYPSLEKFSRLFCLPILFFLCYTSSFSQVLNVTQAGVIENGFGIVPNLTGASSVAVQGNYAYSVGTGNVLEILDITLPGLPTHKGSISNGEGGASIQRVQSIVVRGNYAYLTSYGANAFEIIDVSNPSKPVHKGILRDGGGSAPYLKGVWGITLAGNYAYVTSATSNALEIIDISNPAFPLHRGSLLHGAGDAFLTGAASVQLVGNLAYVGCFGAIEIADVSNPEAPVHKGKLLNGGGVAPFLAAVYSLKVAGNYAYTISADNYALEIIDISNPAQPVHKSSLVDGGGNPPYLTQPFSIEVSGDYAYVGNYDGFPDASNDDLFATALEIINISNPAAPVHVAAVKDPNSFYQCRSVVISNQKIYLTSRAFNSLSIVDVANPSLPKLIASAKTPTEGGALLSNSRSIALSGSNAYVATQGGLEVIDVTNPSQPRHRASLGTDQMTLSPTTVSISGKYAYLSGRPPVIQVVDISNPDIPASKFTVSVLANGLERFAIPFIQVENNLAFVGLAANTNPLQPGQYYMDGIRILLTGDGSGVARTILGTLTHGTGGALLNGITSFCRTSIGPNEYLFVTSAASNALEIVDITNLSNPVHKGKIINGTGGALLGSPRSVAVSGNYAYVASSGSNALEIIDFTNPALPVHKGSITHGQGGAFLEGPWSVYVSGNYAFVACVGTTGDGGLEIIDISDPANPKHYGSLLHGTNGALLDGAMVVTVSGNYAYVLNNGALYQNMDIAYLYGPKLTSFTPAVGPTGTAVTITGQNFTTFLTADVNGVPADVTSVTATSLTFTVPTAATNGKITLNYAGQKFVSENSFIVSPTTTAATDIQQNSFTTHWTDVGAASYFFDLSTDNFTTFVGPYSNFTLGNVTSLSISGLNPATIYQYRVRSSNGTLVSSNSNVASVLTIPSTPVVTTPAIINQTNFTASWAAVTGATDYLLDVSTDEAFTKFLVGYNNLTVTATEQTQIVTGLTSFTHYYYRVRAANATGSSPSSNIIQITTLDITSPAINVAATPNPVTLSAGSSPILNSIITDNVSVDSAQLFYRGISKSSFKKVSMQGPGGLGGNYSITMQPDWYDSLGMEYYFVAKDKAGNKTIGAKNFIQLITPSITIPTLPSGNSQSDYRIIAFPYQLIDNKVTAVYNNVSWNDNTSVGMWWWNPASQNGSGAYDQYGSANTFQNVESGKGYWVITRNPVTPTLSNVPAPKYNRSNLYSMALKPGWNEIGNPYPVPISWDDVIAFNQENNPGAQFSPLTIYDAAGYKAATGSRLLAAFEGGFVKNLGASDITIQIPFAGGIGAGGRKTSITSDISNPNWNIFLHIDQNGRTNELGGFGMHREARSGVDRYDNFNPPGFLDIPEVGFTNEESPGLTFSNDMVSSQDEYIWTFTPGGKEGSATQLTWNNKLNANSSKQLFLLDEELLTVIDMNAVNQYDFTLTRSSKFRIFYGSNVKITTSRIIASAPFPNPMTGEGKTTINVSLPESGSEYAINMQIYNGLGSVIGSLSKRLTPGIHPLEFTLPSSLSEGIYIYKLAVSNEKTSSIHTGKIVKP